MSSRELGALDGEIPEDARILEDADQYHHPNQKPQGLPVNGLDGLLLPDGPHYHEQHRAREGGGRAVDEVHGEHEQHHHKDR